LPRRRPGTAVLAGLLAAGIALSRPAAAATPEDDFQAAENTFRFQDYARAVEQLRPLLYPDVRLSSPDQVVKAHEYLAACYHWLGQDKDMEDEFIALLTQDAAHRLDTFYYPASLIAKFESVRKRLVDLHVIEAEPAPKAPEPPRCERTEETVVRRHWAPNLIPFGVGQFLNGKSTKGALFLTGQVATLGLNIGSWVAIESLRGGDGRYTKADAATARDLRIVQYVGLGTFAALAVWGIVDAFQDFVPETTSVKVVPCPTAPAPGAGLVPGLAVCARF
jgi:hypothetical protein